MTRLALVCMNMGHIVGVPKAARGWMTPCIAPVGSLGAQARHRSLEAGRTKTAARQTSRRRPPAAVVSHQLPPRHRQSALATAVAALLSHGEVPRPFAECLQVYTKPGRPGKYKKGGRGEGTQKFVHQKWPDKISHIVNFVFSASGHFGLGGGGGTPPSPCGVRPF